MDRAHEQPLEEITSFGFKILSEEERALNFTSSIQDEMLEGGKRKIARDPLSHRLIEKRRRDRMNNCLADLSRLIPTYYLKKGRGRIEKTEVIEMAIKYMKHLQAHACSQIETCEITTKQEKAGKEMEQFHIGYQEAMSETLQFLRDSEGLFSGDSLCVRIMNHLNKHCEKIMKSEGYSNLKLNGTISSSSSSSGYHANGSSNGSSSDGNASGSNLVSDSKDALLTEESAYRSDEQLCSDDREISYTPSGGDPAESLMQGVLSGGYQSSSGPGSNTSSSGEDNNSRLYKFKSNMKHRFSADAEHSSQPKKKRRDSESYCGFSEGEKERRYNSHTTHPNGDQGIQTTPKSLSFQPNSAVPKIENDVAAVPAFALSPNGAYYIPITLDHSVVAPSMNSLGEGASSSVLHPVSIYVSFRSPSLLPTTQQPLPSPRSSSPFTEQDSLVPRLNPSYDSYGERCHKEERRKHSGYTYPYGQNNACHSPMHGGHSLIHHTPPHSRTEFRQLRTPTEPLSDISHPPQETIHSQLSPQEQRGIVGRLGIRDFLGKSSNRVQVPWPYNIPPMIKE